jgi:hypothetical protein
MLRHYFLELLLLVPEAVLLLVITLDVVIPLGVVILVGGGVELLPLGAVGDEVGGIATLEASPRWSPPLLVELVQGAELSHQQGDLVVRDALILLIRSYGKEDKENTKADEIVVLVGLASWRLAWALVIKALLVKEASWLGWPWH